MATNQAEEMAGLSGKFSRFSHYCCINKFTFFKWKGRVLSLGVITCGPFVPRRNETAGDVAS